MHLLAFGGHCIKQLHEQERKIAMNNTEKIIIAASASATAGLITLALVKAIKKKAALKRAKAVKRTFVAIPASEYAAYLKQRAAKARTAQAR